MLYLFPLFNQARYFETNSSSKVCVLRAVKCLDILINLLTHFMYTRQIWDPLVSEWRIESRSTNKDDDYEFDLLEKGSDQLILTTGHSFRDNGQTDRQLNIKRSWSSGESVINILEFATTRDCSTSDNQELLYRMNCRIEVDKKTNRTTSMSTTGGYNFSLVSGQLFCYFPGNLLTKSNGKSTNNDQLNQLLLERMLSSLKNSFDINCTDIFATSSLTHANHMPGLLLSKLPSSSTINRPKARPLTRSSSFSSGGPSKSNSSNSNTSGLNLSNGSNNSSTIKCVRV